jgi:hypothetical protein
LGGDRWSGQKQQGGESQGECGVAHVILPVVVTASCDDIAGSWPTTRIALIISTEPAAPHYPDSLRVRIRDWLPSLHRFRRESRV